MCVRGIISSTGMVRMCVLGIEPSTGMVHMCVLAINPSTGMVRMCVLGILSSTGIWSPWDQLRVIRAKKEALAAAFLRAPAPAWMSPCRMTTHTLVFLPAGICLPLQYYALMGWVGEDNVTDARCQQLLKRACALKQVCRRGVPCMGLGPMCALVPCSFRCPGCNSTNVARPCPVALPGCISTRAARPYPVALAGCSSTRVARLCPVALAGCSSTRMARPCPVALAGRSSTRVARPCPVAHPPGAGVYVLCCVWAK